MKWTRVILLVLGLAGVAACSGGGGSGSTVVSPTWDKFRRDVNNSAQGSGPVVKNPGGIPTPVSILWATNIDGSPISASPAIGQINGAVVIGTEGGTFAALNPDTGAPYWTTHNCAAPTTGLPCATLGPLLSSPAIFSFSPTTSNLTTTGAVVASTDGSLYVFQYTGYTAPICAFCFRPAEAGRPEYDSTLESASFVSSPTFLINIATGGALGVFIGATVTPIGKPDEGRLYALNIDGTMKWQFPRSGDPTPIGPITSSPAFGVGNTMYFTTDDGFLYALTLGGELKWRAQLTSAAPAVQADAAAPEPTPIDVAIAPSPVTSGSSVVTSFANGVIQTLNSDGSPYWRNPAPSNDPEFATSLAVGFPVNTPTPTPGFATPTATPTGTIPPFLPLTAVVGVRKSGSIVLLNAQTGDCILKEPTGECKPLPVADVLFPVVGPILSSPVISSDGYIVFGDAAGRLHAVSTLDGTEPHEWLWPHLLVPTPGATPQPIRSAPAVDSDGTIYVGSDDGYMYAVGTPQ